MKRRRQQPARPKPNQIEPAASTGVGPDARGINRRDLAYGLLLVVAVFIVYYPAFHGDFIWDDDTHISDDTAVKAAGGLWDIWFKPGATCQYYPLSFTGFWIGYHLWGLNTLGFHLLNVGLHATAAVLLWQLLKRLKMPGAWLAGALFALHPVCVMSVAWMTELKNTLSASLALGSAWAFVKGAKLGVYGESQSASPRTRSENKQEVPDVRYFWLSLGLFLMAMTAKTAVSFLPVTLVLLTWWKAGKLEWKKVWPVAPMLGIALGMGLLTIFIESSAGMGGASGTRFTLPFVDRLLISGKTFWFYLGKLFFPHPLIFIYGRWQVDAHSAVQWLAVAGMCGILLGAWLARKKYGRGLFAGLTHFYISTSFLILVVVLYMTRYTYVSDHWQYFGCMGILALVAAGLTQGWRKFAGGNVGFGAVGSAVLLGALGLMTWNQSATYKSSETLWVHTLEWNPDCSMANNQYAGILAGEHHDIQGAIEHLKTALKTEPDSFEALNNLGSALLQTGRPAEAIGSLQQAADLNPTNALIQFNLGNAWMQLGRLDSAGAAYARALEINPQFIDGQPRLAAVAWELATSPESSIRNGKLAVQWSEQLNSLAKGADPRILAVLAASYAEAGRFPDAVKTAESAISSPAAAAAPELGAALQEELSSYRSQKPFRQPQATNQKPAGKGN